MNAYKKSSLTPKMCAGLKLLVEGNDLDHGHCHTGRPTKQRLAKFGLAEYLTPQDWDGPMRLTDKGRTTATMLGIDYPKETP